MRRLQAHRLGAIKHRRRVRLLRQFQQLLSVALDKFQLSQVIIGLTETIFKLMGRDLINTIIVIIITIINIITPLVELVPQML